MHRPNRSYYSTHEDYTEALDSYERAVERAVDAEDRPYTRYFTLKSNTEHASTSGEPLPPGTIVRVYSTDPLKSIEYFFPNTWLEEHRLKPNPSRVPYRYIYDLYADTLEQLR